MPTLDLKKWEKNKDLFSFMNLYCVMLFPNDLALRNRLKANISAVFQYEWPKMRKDILSGKWPIKYPSKEFVEKNLSNFEEIAGDEMLIIFELCGGIKTLYNSPEFEKIRGDVKACEHQGYIAGRILSYIIRMDLSKIRSGGSLGKAVFFMENYVTGAKVEGLPYNNRYIMQAW